jgi:hypothetical protein
VADLAVRSDALALATAGVRFELTEPFRTQRLSRPPRSTAPAPRLGHTVAVRPSGSPRFDLGFAIHRGLNWEAVSDFGGEAEVNQYCGAANYGTPFCWYPWYSFKGAANAFTYGGDYPGTTKDFGQALQFQQQENCASPANGSPQYCSTVLC